MIGNNLNSKIELLGLKRVYLSTLLGVSKSYVTNLLNGKIYNYDKMQKLNFIINEYEDAAKKNCLI